MNYKYKNIDLHLENDEVYWLFDLLLYALDYDCEKKCLTGEKREFAKKLINILDEQK